MQGFRDVPALCNRNRVATSCWTDCKGTNKGEGKSKLQTMAKRESSEVFSWGAKLRGHMGTEESVRQRKAVCPRQLFG